MCGRINTKEKSFQPIAKTGWSLLAGLLCLLFSLPNVQAQDTYMGIRSGINRSNWATTGQRGSSKIKSQNTLNMGLIFLYELPEQNSLQIELNFIRSKAFTQVEPEASSHISPASHGSFALTYVETPFLFRFDFGDRFKFFGSIGASVSYLIHVNQRSVTLFDAPSFDVSIIDKNLLKREDFNPIRIGAVFGCGFDVEIKENHLIIDLKNNRGFSNLVNGSSISTRTDSFTSLWLNELTLSVGYLIEL